MDLKEDLPERTSPEEKIPKFPLIRTFKTDYCHVFEEIPSPKVTSSTEKPTSTQILENLEYQVDLIRQSLDEASHEINLRS